jgi:hypothetical protein
MSGAAIGIGISIAANTLTSKVRIYSTLDFIKI